MDPRRSHPRVNVHVARQLYLPGNIVLDCRLRDLSRGGALIVFAKAEKLPERLGLRIHGSDKIREVVIAWRGSGEFGVRFQDATAGTR